MLMTILSGANLSGALRWNGACLGEAELAGVRGWVYGQLDVSEAERRGALGLGPVLDWSLLEALAQLPLQVKVPREVLDPIILCVLDSAPPGVLDRGPDYVTRLFSPVIRPSGWGSHATRGLTGWIRGVSLFAASFPRAVLTDSAPSRAALAEAATLGVGVVRASGEVLVLPSSRHVRVGPRRWRVQEQLWQQIAQT